MSRRVLKLQDVVAHAGSTRCARLGEKSGQVLATGSEDKRVNIWKIGKPNAMMSLTGHGTAVECLVFDKQEEVLVVGCAGGSMQVWNLEYRKMAGTLAGHRTACTSVEFHPYGEFFASGSADTNLKIWDLRRKSCIQTYKGHSEAITTIKFSPHGRWVATGGKDNQVKLWDLTAGKLMRDLDMHKGAITSVAFHPKEYLLATGSVDRTAKLWSLETFRMVGSTELGSSPVQAVKFCVEEQSVLTASHDALRSHTIDALATTLDTIDVDWRGLQDTRLLVPEEKFLAVTADGPQLGIWVADLQKRDAVKSSGGEYGRLHGRAAPAGQAKLQTAPRWAAEDACSGDRLGADPGGETVLPPRRASPTALDRPQDEACDGVRASEPEPDDEPPPARQAAAGRRRHANSPAEHARDRATGRGEDAGLAAEITHLAGQHQQMMGVLRRRLEQANRLKEVWGTGNLAGLHSTLNVKQDPAAFCDFLRAVMQRRLEEALNLDACGVLLPALQDLLGSKYADFVQIAAQFIEVLLQHFGDIIVETRQSCSRMPERQPDLAREDRLRKCNACYDHFREIHRLLPDRQMGSQYGTVKSSLQTFLLRS